MTKITGLLAIAATLVSMSARADRAFVCTGSSMTPIENLTVKGSGQDAQVHLENDSMAGDYTFNAWFNGQANSDDDVEGTPDYLDLGFVGLAQDKANPSSPKFPGGFFLSPEVLNGQNGTILIWINDARTVLNCK